MRTLALTLALPLTLAACAVDFDDSSGPGGKADDLGGTLDGIYYLARLDDGKVVGSGSLRLVQAPTGALDFWLDVRDHGTLAHGLIDGAKLPVIEGKAVLEVDADCALTLDLGESAAGAISIAQRGACETFIEEGVTFDGRFDRNYEMTYAGSYASAELRGVSGALAIRETAAGEFAFTIALTRAGSSVGSVEGSFPTPANDALHYDAGDGCAVVLQFFPGAVDVTQDGYCAKRTSSRASFGGFYVLN